MPVRLRPPPPWKRRQLACHSALKAVDPVINWDAGSIPASSSNGMKKKKIEFASDKRISYLQTWVDQIMEAICPEYLFISDESSIGDFDVEEEDLPRLRKELGVDVKRTDLIVDVAQRMKDAFG